MHCYHGVHETQIWDSFNIARIVTWAVVCNSLDLKCCVRFQLQKFNAVLYSKMSSNIIQAMQGTPVV